MTTTDERKRSTKQQRICVVGAGHVGLVAAACFGKLDHKVICVDNDGKKIARLKKGIMPFFEPEMAPLVNKACKQGRLKFLTRLDSAIRASDIIFIAVGTPPLPDGSADLTAVENVARAVAQNLNGYKLVVEKSTVPVQTGKKIKETIYRYKKCDIACDVASNPEFLREGKAVYDFFCPDRIVLGVETDRSEKLLRDIYAGVKAPLVVTDINTAELIKHASNSFLAAKISFINAVSRVCDLAGADVTKVAQAMGMDKRIGPQFLDAGVGWGGFCLDENEKVIVKDDADCVGIMAMKELFDQAREGKKFDALSFDMEKKKICFKNITVVTRRNYKGNMVELNTSMNRKIVVTADHPMIVSDAGRLSVIEAGRIKNGDLLPLFTNMPALNKNITVDLFDLLSGTDFYSCIKVRPIDKKVASIGPAAFGLLRKARGYKTWRTFDFKRGNYLKFDDYLLLEKKGFLKGFQREEMLLFTSGGSTTYIRGKFVLDKTLLKLLGCYISEGHISSDKGKNNRRDGIVFTFNKKEKEYIKETTDALDFLRIKYTLRPIIQDNAVRITSSSKIFAYLISDILKCDIR